MEATGWLRLPRTGQPLVSACRHATSASPGDEIRGWFKAPQKMSYRSHATIQAALPEQGLRRGVDSV